MASAFKVKPQVESVSYDADSLPEGTDPDVFYRTASSFSDFVGDRIAVRFGKSVERSGKTITVVAGQEQAYEDLERLLAEVVFGTNTTMRDVFCKEVSTSYPAEIRAGVLDDLVSTWNLLERVRVLSLWESVYAGSAHRIRQIYAGFKTPTTNVKKAVHRASVSFENSASGLVQEAIDTVREHGPLSTFVALKKIEKLVAEEAKQPNGSEQDATQSKPDDAGSGEKNNGEDEGSSYGEGTDDMSDTQQQLSVALANVDPTDSTLITAVLADDKSSVDELREFVVTPTAPKAGNSATNLSWFQIRPEGDRDVLSSEDSEAVRSIRAQLARVMRRETYAISDVGVDIDIDAVVRRASGEMSETRLFADVKRSRGLVAAILIDRSASMKKEGGLESAFRAARILAGALSLPFVRVFTYGFTSVADGSCDMTEYVDTERIRDTVQSPPGNVTPTFHAVSAVSDRLRTHAGTKHIFLVTGGRPIYAERSGHPLPFAVAVDRTRSAISEAQRRGVKTTTFIVGDDKVRSSDLKTMYGRYTRCTEATLSKVLSTGVVDSVVRCVSGRG